MALHKDVKGFGMLLRFYRNLHRHRPLSLCRGRICKVNPIPAAGRDLFTLFFVQSPKYLFPRAAAPHSGHLRFCVKSRKSAATTLS
jgi:hypothetical protein